MLGQGLNSLIPGSEPEPLLPEYTPHPEALPEVIHPAEEKKSEPERVPVEGAVPFDLLPKQPESVEEVRSDTPFPSQEASEPEEVVELPKPEEVIPVPPPTPMPTPREEVKLVEEKFEEAPQVEATFAIASASTVVASPAVSPLPEPHSEPPRDTPQALPQKPTPQPVAPVENKAKDLSRLFSVAEEQKHIRPSDFIYHIELSKITSNPDQPRRIFNEEGIRDLANSIREFGILQPIVVTKHEHEVPTGTEVEYELISGERRVLASRFLGLERIPAIIKNVKLERERLELAVIENIQRENLNPIETARAFARLQDEFRLTQREIAARLGKSREVVANTLRLLDLPPYILQSVESGQISESHARLLLSIPDPAAQEKLFADLLNTRFTTRELRRRVKELSAQQGTLKGVGVSETPEMKMAAERLSQELGTPVSIDATSGKGKITISFYSEEELKALISKLQSHLEGEEF